MSLAYDFEYMGMDIDAMDLENLNLTASQLDTMLNNYPLGSNMTNMLDYTTGEYEVMKQPAWIGVTVTLYIIVMLMGIAANGMIIFIVLRHKYMRTVTNIFICNLAMADLGLCLFNMPIQLHYQVTGTWAFGHVLCRIIFASFGVPLFVSTLTFLLIAFDRYYLIVYPLRSHIKMKTACLLIGGIAVIALSISTPMVIFTETNHVVEPLLNMDNTYCIETWTTANKQIYSIAMFLLKFIFPLITSAILYGLIYRQLENRSMGQRDANRNERRKRTCKILVSIVTVFMVCWLPWSIFNLMADFVSYDDITNTFGRYFQLIDLFLKLFAMTSTCINPFLYGWLNENFRKELDVICGRRLEQTLRRTRQSCTLDRSDITGLRSKIDALIFNSAVTKNNTMETQLTPSPLHNAIDNDDASVNLMDSPDKQSENDIEENGNHEKLLCNGHGVNCTME